MQMFTCTAYSITKNEIWLVVVCAAYSISLPSLTLFTLEITCLVHSSLRSCFFNWHACSEGLN